MKKRVLFVLQSLLLILSAIYAADPDPVTQKLDSILETDNKLREEKRTEDRIRLLNEALQIALAEKRNPYVAKIYSRFGGIFLGKKEYGKSEEYLHQAIEADPNLPDPHALLGRIHYLAQRWDEAEREFKLGLDYLPTKAVSLMQLSQIASLKGRPEEALDYFREWEQFEPQNESLHWRKGLFFTDLKRHEEAEKAFQRSIEIKPTSAAYLYLGWLRFAQARDQEALDWMLKAEQLAPEDEEIQWRMGTVYRFSGNMAEAEKRFLRSIDLKPTGDGCLHYAAMLFTQKGRAQDAESFFRKGVELRGQPSAPLLGAFGSELTRQKRYEEALQIWNDALKLDAQNPNVQSGLAITLFSLERLDESLPHLEKAIQIKTEKGEPADQEIGMVATIYDALGKYEEGIKLLKQTVEAGIEKKDPFLHFWGLFGLADLYMKQGLHKEALQRGEQAIAMLRTAPEYNDLLMTALLAVASEAAAVRDFALAEKHLQQASEVLEMLAPETQNRRRIELLRVQGYVHTVRDDFSQAIEVQKRVLQLAVETGWIEKQLDAMENLNSLYRRTGDFQQAAQMFQEFERTLSQVEDENTENRYLEVAAKIVSSNGDYEKALSYVDKSLQLSTVQKIPIQASKALQQRADYLNHLGKYEEALQSLQQALERVREHPRVPREIASCKNAMAGIFASMGDFRRSRELFEESRKIYQEIQRKDLLVDTLVYLADLDYELGDSTRAFQTYEQAARAYNELESVLDEADQYFMMGTIREEQKQYDAAIVHFQKSLDIARQQNDRIHALFATEAIARQLMLSGKLEEAEKEFQDLLKIAGSAGGVLAGLKERLAQSMGELYILKKNYTESEQWLTQLVNAEKNSTYPTRWRAWYFLGIAQRELGKTEAALNSLKTSVKIIEKKRQATAGTPQDGNFRAKYREIYNALIELLFRERKLDEAYYYIELEKIAEFQDQRISARVKVPESDQTVKARQYQFRLMEIQKQISAELSKDASYRDQDLVDNLNRFRGALEKEFKTYLKEHPELETRLEHKPRQLGSVMNSIPEGVIVIQPVILPDRIATLVYSHGGRLVVETPIATAEVNKILNEFRSLLRDGTSSQVKELGAKLYDLLIQPFENQMEQARLLVVAASGNLRKIPFQSLYDGKKQQFLVEKVPVVNLASLKFEYPDWQKENIRILAIADPAGDLLEAKNQADRISKIFPTKIYLHDQAVPENLRWDKTKEHFNVLMFATHAKLDDLEPENSYILLANNNHLTYEEISEFRPYWQDEIRLAVLSGCETAAIPEIEESAISHLAAEFDEIGIHSILATLWKVNDASTSDLMVSFFQNLKQNLSLAEALQKAQLQLLHQQKSPYHWAPFILLGDWR